MAITGLRQDLQVQPCASTVQNAAPGATMATGSTSLENDIVNIHSQLARWMDPTGGVNWYDDVYTNAGNQKYGIKQLSDAVYAQAQQLFTISAGIYASVAVPAGANYVILNAAGNQAPSGPLAIALTSKGAVVAQSSQNGAAFAANELAVIAGQDSLNPLNKLTIRNNSNGNPVEDSTGEDIFGLLQLESTGSDGGTANDSVGGSRVKISFVKVDYANKVLKAADPADVGGVSINYLYRTRLPLSQLPQGALSNQGGFVDNIGVADVTFTRAVANQAGAPVPVPQPMLLQVPNGSSFKVQSANGGQDFLAVVPTASGTTATVNVNQVTVTTTTPSSFSQGATVATNTQSVNLGTTLGQIDSAGLTLASTGGNPLKLVSSAQVAIKDAFIGTSNWTSAQLNVAAGAAEYNAYKTAFGEVSVLAGMVAASKAANHQIAYGQITQTAVAANTNITGAGASPNLSVQFPSYASASNPAASVKIMFNGVLLIPGTTKGWYPGTSAATGDIMLTFAVRGGATPDTIQFEMFGTT